jgi:hypothetical protein
MLLRFRTTPPEELAVAEEEERRLYFFDRIELSHFQMEISRAKYVCFSTDTNSLAL